MTMKMTNQVYGIYAEIRSTTSWWFHWWDVRSTNLSWSFECCPFSYLCNVSSAVFDFPPTNIPLVCTSSLVTHRGFHKSNNTGWKKINIFTGNKYGMYHKIIKANILERFHNISCCSDQMNNTCIPHKIVHQSSKINPTSFKEMLYELIFFLSSSCPPTVIVTLWSSSFLSRATDWYLADRFIKWTSCVSSNIPITLSFTKMD